MATITSSRTGSWDEALTWVGGLVPDLEHDDVIIASGHFVWIESYDDLTLSSGRQITVQGNAGLDVLGSLIVEADASIGVAGSIAVDEGTLEVFGNVIVFPMGSMALDYDAMLMVAHGGTLGLAGYLWSGYGSFIVVFGEMTIGGTADVFDYSLIYVYGTMTIGGNVYIEYDSDVFALGTLDIANSGSINFYDSRMEIRNTFKLARDAELYIGWQSMVRAWKDVHISGHVDASGGFIKMVRREGQVRNYFGNPAIVFDQAYGHGTTVIA